MSFESRKQARIENYEKRQAAAEVASNEAASRSMELSKVIPFGQPILVDHYSAKSHRAHIDKIDSLMSKAVSLDKKADYYADKISGAENNNAIYSDSEDAVKRIEDKIAKLKKESDACKLLNKRAKKENLDDLLKLEEFSFVKRYGTGCFSCPTHPVPSFHLASFSAEIRRLTKRLDFFKREETINVEERNFSFCGGRVEFSDMYWQVYFDAIPSAEIRSKLKAYPLGLKWSGARKAWVRKHTGTTGPRWQKELKDFLNGPNFQEDNKNSENAE